MHVWRRLVWWKGLFWAAIGCGCGAAVAAYGPEVGAPAGVRRVTVERAAIDLTASNGRYGASNLVLYPDHHGVRLLTLTLYEDGNITPAYLYAPAPFVTVAQLRTAVKYGRLMARYRPVVDPSAVYAGRLTTAADQAIADVDAQPGHAFATVDAFLAHLRGGPAVARAWWAEPRWRRQMPVAAGAVLVGLLGTWFTRRSAADVAAADLLRRAPPPSAPVAPPVDLSKVEALDALLLARLESGDELPATVQIAPASAAVGPETVTTPAAAGPVVLHGEPVAAVEAAAAEDKAYAGEYYPTVRPAAPRGFSLVELMVSIGVIGILVALLLPALVGARRSADTIACASNLHAIGQGMTIYLGANRNTFPPAYLYIGHSIVDNVQTPTTPAAGYVHWSSYLYGSGTVPAKAFQCPAMRQGGLPPTNTPVGNRDSGQKCPGGDAVVDQQVPRLAYTVNEVLCPRNKFVTPPFYGSRVYRFVKANEVARSAETILATEMIDDDWAVSYDDEGTGWVMSHRPICGYFGVDGTLDMFKVPVGTGFRATTAADLDADPATTGPNSHTRLDLVGRNHGRRAGYPDRRLSNFLYVDGHVRTQSVYDTVRPSFQWGDRFYSLTPNNDQVGP